jgi:uncharacterized protein
VIDRTFVFLEGVGANLERHFKVHGIQCWDDFLDASLVPGISLEKKKRIDIQIKLARKHLSIKNHEFFSLNIPKSEHWRLFDIFREDACYLDIETTGLSPAYDDITMISTWNGKEIMTFTKGENLNSESLNLELNRYKLLVTFNLPFMFKKYPMLKKNFLHMDLRWACKRIGLTGGLKLIEKKLGVSREDELADVDGREAVRLWRRWQRNKDEQALLLLKKYNQADVINLEKLAEIVKTSLEKQDKFTHNFIKSSIYSKNYG